MAKKGETALDKALGFFIEANGKTMTPKEIETKLPRRRATGIVWELKKRGHEISQKEEKGKIVSYTLVSVNEKMVPKPAPAAPVKAAKQPKGAAKTPTKKKPAANAAAPQKKAAAKKAPDPGPQKEPEQEQQAAPVASNDNPPEMKAASYEPPKLSQKVVEAAAPEPMPWRTAAERGEPANIDPEMPMFLRRV